MEEKNEKLKESTTKFKKLFYDAETDSSLIECYLVSGKIKIKIN